MFDLVVGLLASLVSPIMTIMTIRILSLEIGNVHDPNPDPIFIMLCFLFHLVDFCPHRLFIWFRRLFLRLLCIFIDSVAYSRLDVRFLFVGAHA